MFEKSGKFYADWRDRKGVRRRKSFTSPKAALKFEAEQKELAHPKSRGRGQVLPRYSAPVTGIAVRTARKPQSSKPSSRLQVASNHTSCANHTSSKSSNERRARGTRTSRE